MYVTTDIKYTILILYYITIWSSSLIPAGTCMQVHNTAEGNHNVVAVWM